MEIAYVVNPRPDTGLWNAKIAIWLFIASEVMLFGGLFSGYVFLRIGAEPGTWQRGIMDVPVGTINTAILIASSITAVLAWAKLKMRQFSGYKFWMGVTILLGIVFLCIKLGVEYPAKWKHFGAYIKKDQLAKYEANLGNTRRAGLSMTPRVEITGHLEEVIINPGDSDKAALDAALNSHNLVSKAEGEGKNLAIETKDGKGFDTFSLGALKAVPGVKIEEYVLNPDPANAEPNNPDNDRPHFFVQHAVEGHPVTISAEDTTFASMFVPKHSSFLAIYFTVTALHALHVIGGLIVFIYFFLPFGSSLYKKNPEHFTNRIEVASIYWHFVDLVWIFAFPIFYLL